MCSDPIIFASIGTILVVGSAAITGFYISHVEGVIAKLESGILKANSQITFDFEAIQRSYQHLSTAEIKLLILHASPPSVSTSSALRDAAKGILQGILERHVAATGEAPSSERFREFESVAEKASKGDVSAFSELSEISSELLLQWTQRRVSMGEERDQKLQKVTPLKTKINRCRYFSVTLQILGLIVVLLKDVASA